MQVNCERSIRQGCQSVRISRSVFYYRSRKQPDTYLESALRDLAERHVRWGMWMMADHLKALGYPWNHKRVHRVYKALGLHLRRKGRRRLPERIKQHLAVPQQPNQTWSMDFMSDTLWNGRRFRVLTMIDDHNREALHIEVDTSLSSYRVVRVLEQLIQMRDKPTMIRVDNGPEFISENLSAWCFEHGIELVHIQPGRPTQNAYIERFNGTYRREILDSYIFETLDEVRRMSSEWIQTYNQERPHRSLNRMTPKRFLESKPKNSTLNRS